MYQQQYDPVYTSICSSISGWNYGMYQNTVAQNWYTFLKQYTGFTISQTTLTYGKGVTLPCLCLSGNIEITYESKPFKIPVSILLPSGYPATAPKVFLTYKLDQDSAAKNPLIKNGCEVVNNYLHKWNGGVPQYNLGGLCYNLMKSFEMYPPLGESPAETKEIEKPKSIFGQVTSAAAKAVDTVGDGLYTLTHPEEKKAAEESKGLPSSSIGHSKVTPEAKARTDKIQQLADKLQERFKSLETFFEKGHSEVDPFDNHLTRSKTALEENGMKLKTEYLVIEGEKAEMKDKIKEIAAFIRKHKGKEVTADNIDDFVCPADEDPQTMIENIKSKEESYEAAIDMCKKLYRKKSIELQPYLNAVRELAEEEFYQIAMRNKITNLLKTCKC